jgi:hypothetical protein
MSAGAWMFMTLSWLFVIALNLFCLGRLLGANNRKK